MFPIREGSPRAPAGVGAAAEGRGGCAKSIRRLRHARKKLRINRVGIETSPKSRAIRAGCAGGERQMNDKPPMRRFKEGPKRKPNEGNPANRSARRRAFREQLWRQNPNCFKCGM